MCIIYFVISLESTMRLSSLTTNGPTHTICHERGKKYDKPIHVLSLRIELSVAFRS